jgi:hypothetical protein
MSDQYDGPAMAQQILRLRAERDALKAEVAHWKANHASEVQRARILKERPDIPIERVQAYEQWGKDQAERDALKAEVAILRQYGNKDCTAMADEAIDAAREVQL